MCYFFVPEISDVHLGHLVASLFINSLQNGHSCLFPLVNNAIITATGPKKSPRIKPQRPSPFVEPIIVVTNTQHNQKIIIFTIFRLSIAINSNFYM